MAANKKVINGVEWNVSAGNDGVELLSRNFRSLKQEAQAAGTCDFRINKHAFFLGGKTFYIGPSLQGKNAAELGSIAKEIQVCDCSTDGGTSVVSTLFLASSGEAGTLSF